jgi:hypothetical protein
MANQSGQPPKTLAVGIARYVAWSKGSTLVCLILMIIPFFYVQWYIALVSFFIIFFLLAIVRGQFAIFADRHARREI